MGPEGPHPLKYETLFEPPLKGIQAHLQREGLMEHAPSTRQQAWKRKIDPGIDVSKISWSFSLASVWLSSPGTVKEKEEF